jgi:ubiquinone/menaquinone biosynthesis C-methylase UbiE
MSCAFGNISEKIADKCLAERAHQFVLTDIIQSEIDNAQKKLRHFGDLCTYSLQDVTRTDFADGSFDYVVMFFLPHEVPYEKKEQLIEEADRLLKPGGKLVVGEFHKPSLKILEILGRIYFFIFEPYATEMWYRFDFSETMQAKIPHHYTIEKETFLFDNFQVVTATRLH